MERLYFKGYGQCESFCGIKRNGDNVILYELNDNPGTSITNAVTIIATDLVENFGIDPDSLVIIEKYPEFPSKSSSKYNASYSLALLKRDEHYFNGRTVLFACPEYKALTESEALMIFNAPAT